MNAISLLVAMFLAGICDATPHIHRQDGQVFRVTTWACRGKPELAVWERRCPKEGHSEEQGWWGRPFLLMREDGKGFYLNRFGEAMAGLHVDVDEVYIPSCDV